MKKDSQAKDKSGPKQSRSRPATTLEGRENQLIALAVDLAEQQLRDGTASSQVITHYLKLGSTKERLEKKNLEMDVELKEAKKDALQTSRHIEELYMNALNAMRTYSGQVENNDEEL